MKAAQLFDLSGRFALVTGAASGLGRAMAAILAENGATVFLADINESALETACADLAAAGGAVHGMVMDLAKPESVASVIDEIVRRCERLDVVFANGGTTAGPGFCNPIGQIENVALESWNSSMLVNLTGAFATMKFAARHMKARRSGSIIVTTSVAALKTSALPGYAYFAAKAGIAQVVKVAALELAPFNVRVNGIAPGPFPTNFAGGRMRDPTAQALFVAGTPMGRVGHLDEIKGLALLLASDASSYLTGAIIPIDGGTSVA